MRAVYGWYFGDGDIRTSVPPDRASGPDGH